MGAEKRYINPWLAVLFISVAAIMIPAEAVGQASFVDSLNEFQEVVSLEWRARVFATAIAIFISLAILDLIFFAIGLKFSDKEVAILPTLSKKLIILIFFFVMLIFYWSLDILVEGFQQIAGIVSGNPQVYSEADIMMLGFQFFGDILRSESGFWANARRVAEGAFLGGASPSSLRLFMKVTAAILIFIAFLVIAMQYAYLTIEVMIALSISPVFLAFLPMRITRGFPERYLSYIFGLAVKVFLFYIILAFMMVVLHDQIEMLSDEGIYSFTETWGLLFLAWLTVTVLGKLPSKMAQFVAENQNVDFGKLITRINEI